MHNCDSFYKENILNRSDEMSILPSLAEENRRTVSRSEEPLLQDLSWLGHGELKNKGGVYYISDIHLDHKIYKAFKENGNRDKVESFVHQIAENLILDDNEDKIYFPISFYGNPATIIIAGDTSHSFAIAKMFYKHLSQILPYYRDVFVVLGNHELWEFNSVDEALYEYGKFFDSLPNIHLLHNSLYIDGYYREIEDAKHTQKPSDERRHKNRIKKSILSQEDLLKITPEELGTKCSDSKKIIFGTIGYSPLNKRFNASNGIYRKALKSLDAEKEKAEITEKIYKKICCGLPKNHILVVSHMPLEDWTKLPHLELWTYFNGHTHINKKQLDENGHIYSDNQVGYYGKRIKFNTATVESKYDYFAYYDDGIYDISEAQYHEFYFGFSKTMRGIDKRGSKKYAIKMIKNNGIYLFLFESEKGDLYLLEGGKRHILKKKDINYYFDNLILLNETLKKAIGGIQDYIKQLSLFIKHIGGDGRIHGSIVDIDFYNHIMVDIRNGTLIPYFALNISDRYEYPSVPKLLEENRPELYKKYLENGKNLPVLMNRNEISISAKHNNDTSIYKDSNIMLKIQDMIDYNVVRFWNDELIETITDRRPSSNAPKKELPQG